MATLSPAVARHIIVPVLLLGATACTGMEALGDIINAGAGLGGRETAGEIRSVDTRRQEIQLSNVRGQTERIRYDNRTQVVYQQRRYDVRNLERGDYVRVRLESDRNGALYASYITVQQDARAGRGGNNRGNARIQRLDGTVARIDTNRGWFDLQQDRGQVVQVTLPYEPSRSLRDRFRRLRRGERVRIEAEILNPTRAELRRIM